MSSCLSTVLPEFKNTASVPRTVYDLGDLPRTPARGLSEKGGPVRTAFAYDCPNGANDG